MPERGEEQSSSPAQIGTVLTAAMHNRWCLRCLEVYDEFELLGIEQDGRNKMLGKWRRLS